MITLDVERDKEKLLAGYACPHCGQYIKMYRRTITSSLAVFLWGLYKKTKMAIYSNPKAWPYYHIEEIYSYINRPHFGPRDVCIMRYWGLVEDVPADYERPQKVGYWKITDTGKAFVENRIAISKYCFVLNAKADHYGGPAVTFADCLKFPWSYKELLSFTTDVTNPSTMVREFTLSENQIADLTVDYLRFGYGPEVRKL